MATTTTKTKTFGTIVLDKNGPTRLGSKRARWKIKAEPHVMSRIKRVFHGWSQDAQNFLYLDDTEDNGRDLLWFLQRYPMESPNRAVLAKRSKASLDREQRVHVITGADYVPPAFEQMALPPRDYQRVAANLLIENGALLLADDPGLGKTISAITAFSEPRTLPVLVVTLTALPTQWAREIHRCLPHLRVHILPTGPDYDPAMPPVKRGQPAAAKGWPDILVCNYHRLARWRDRLAGRIRMVVFDEIQELRHPDTEKYGAAVAIARGADFCMGLSATPIANYGGEIQCVLDVLKADCVGSASEFYSEWLSGSKGVLKNPDDFGTYARSAGFILRRTRADVGRELPPISHIEHIVDYDEKALDAVDDRVAELAEIILGGQKLEKGASFRAHSEISYKLRMATGVGKAPYVAAFVRMLVETGESVLLFGYHREVYSIWLDILKDLNPVMFTGTETTKEKLESQEAFMTGKTKILIMSTRAGAGLDGLQKVCKTTVHGELDWSPAITEQNISRIARDGQEFAVMSYFLTTDWGSDPVIADVLGIKADQLRGVRDPGTSIGATEEADPEAIRKLAQAFLAQRKKKHAHRASTDALVVDAQVAE